jgi:hypothetical protein
VKGEYTAEGKNCHWYLLTVCEIGVNPAIRIGSQLSNRENPNRVGVLAEPFPWTVAQVEVHSWTHSRLGGMSCFAAFSPFAFRTGTVIIGRLSPLLEPSAIDEMSETKGKSPPVTGHSPADRRGKTRSVQTHPTTRRPRVGPE